MATELRPLTIENYDDIIRIWGLAGLPTKPDGRERKDIFAREIALEHVGVFGLYVEGEMVGVGIANWDGRRGWINRVAIHPDHRGHGYAGMIIRECIRFLEDQGALVICALIEELNYPSITAFQKEGINILEGIHYLSKYKYDGA